MNFSRRKALGIMASALPAAAMQNRPTEMPSGIETMKGAFTGTRESLRGWEIPEWFQDAKFGIWAHWGPQSAIEAGDWYARNMYMQGSEQYEYHCEHYGHPSKFGFKDTIPQWKAEKWDPAMLMKMYKEAGAKYFFSMGVHHDNFDMWNSKHQHWNAANMGPKKDILGLWQKAAKAEGLKFGVSDHLWITYKWFSTSHGHDMTGPLAGVAYDGADPKNFSLYVDSDEVHNTLDWNENGIPEWWKKHWYMRMRDLVDNYEPDILYIDGDLSFEEYGLSLVAQLYNQSAKKNGGKAQSIYTSKRARDAEHGIALLDVERGVVDGIWPRPWQTDTCIGDWHYKRGVKYKTAKTVVDLLVDIVSRNGNLLLNFPLPASGMLDHEELNVLAGITDWMKVNSEAIHGTRPWKIYGLSPAAPPAPADEKAMFNENKRKDLTEHDVRFTTKGGTIYAFVMGWPDYKAVIKPLALDTALRVGKIQNVELLGFDGKLEWKQDQDGLSILTPPKKPSDHAVAFKITGA